MTTNIQAQIDKLDKDACGRHGLYEIATQEFTSGIRSMIAVAVDEPEREMILDIAVRNEMYRPDPTTIWVYRPEDNDMKFVATRDPANHIALNLNK